MIPITKDEAMYLRSKGVHCPMVNKQKHSSQKSYFAISDAIVMDMLIAYREQKYSRKD